MNEEEVELLQDFSDKVHEKRKSTDAPEFLFIMIESMIFVGPTLVGQARTYNTYFIRDKMELKKNNKVDFRLASRQKDENEEDDAMIGAFNDDYEPFVRDILT